MHLDGRDHSPEGVASTSTAETQRVSMQFKNRKQEYRGFSTGGKFIPTSILDYSKNIYLKIMLTESNIKTEKFQYANEYEYILCQHIKSFCSLDHSLDHEFIYLFASINSVALSLDYSFLHSFAQFFPHLITSSFINGEENVCFFIPAIKTHKSDVATLKLQPLVFRNMKRESNCEGISRVFVLMIVITLKIITTVAGHVLCHLHS